MCVLGSLRCIGHVWQGRVVPAPACGLLWAIRREAVPGRGADMAAPSVPSAAAHHQRGRDGQGRGLQVVWGGLLSCTPPPPCLSYALV